jgi:hypothetical protein
MALTAAQRRKLPRSAFAYNTGPRSNWKYPIPTRAQAKKAGIPEGQRLRLHRNALSRAAQSNTTGSYQHVAKHVRRRSSGKVKPSRKR